MTYSKNLHIRLSEQATKLYGFTFREKEGWYDERLITPSAIVDLLEEIERLQGDVNIISTDLGGMLEDLKADYTSEGVDRYITTMNVYISKLKNS